MAQNICNSQREKRKSLKNHPNHHFWNVLHKKGNGRSVMHVVDYPTKTLKKVKKWLYLICSQFSKYNSTSSNPDHMSGIDSWHKLSKTCRIAWLKKGWMTSNVKSDERIEVGRKLSCKRSEKMGRLRLVVTGFFLDIPHEWMSLETLVKVGRLGKSYLLFKILGKLICYSQVQDKFRVVRHLKRGPKFFCSAMPWFFDFSGCYKTCFSKDRNCYNFILVQSLNFTDYLPVPWEFHAIKV